MTWNIDEYIEKERKNPTLPCLTTVDEQLKRDALENWKKGEVEGVLCLMPNTYRLTFVFDNLIRLHAIGKYEEALLSAYIGTRTNWGHWPMNEIKELFDIADPDKLRAAGDPIPSQDTFTLYRGVSGKGPKRRVNGYSWTGSLDLAIWFAKRFEDLFKYPAVYEVTVSKEHILAATNERNEYEYLLRLPLPKKPKRMLIDLTKYDISVHGKVELKAGATP